MRFLKLLKLPLFITAIYFALLAYLNFTQFGFFSVVEKIPIDIKKTLSPERIIDEFDNHLLKGEKTIAKFKAGEDNLGIILVEFIKSTPIVTDTLVFRIKREGEDKWHYENKYKAYQVQSNQYFAFGFPLISNSKSNTYIFELESLEGTYENGVGVSLKEPKIEFVYKYSQSNLKNYETLSSFIFKKFVYAAENLDFWQIIVIFVLSFSLDHFFKVEKITFSGIVRFLRDFKESPKQGFKLIVYGIKANYLLQEKELVNFFKKATRWFTSTKFYLLLLNTNFKKRLTIGVVLFLLALTYRFSSSLVNQHLFFYAGLGGQGDYDQFIRAATCALNFCSYAILGQNFLFEASVLGIFYKIFGFTGALKAYLYLMLILSSIVATLPHFLLSRKNWISLGGILGSIYLATSDFLTNMSLNFPPDNGSLFIFSIFFIVYLLTINIGTIRWLVFLGLIGIIDALNKALFILNDLVALALFVPVFFFEKVRESGKSIFSRKNVKIFFLSLIPLLVFLIIYSLWEYLVYIKFSAPYFLRGLIQSEGANYVYYTSYYDNYFLVGDILFKLFYLSTSAIVMVKRLIGYTDLRIIFLAPIFLGMFILTFVKKKVPIKKLIIWFILSASTVLLLVLVKNNYLKIHEIFAGEYIADNWKTNIYFRIFLFLDILFLFVLNFRYSAIKLVLPIIFYIIMLITFAKNASIPRLHTHVVAWSVILLAFLIDFLMVNINKYFRDRIRIILGFLLLLSFLFIYMVPKTTAMFKQLNSGFVLSQNQVRYLRWVNSELPQNAIVLAGGKSDFVTLAENIKRPIVYNSIYSAALLIKPNQIPGISPTDFSIIPELKNKDNFKRKRYLILEDDIYIWRARLTGAVDNVFVISPKTLDPNDYTIKVYKFNSTLKKGIYELTLKSDK